MEIHIECWNCGDVKTVVGESTPVPLTPPQLAEAAYAAGYETYRDNEVGRGQRLLFFCCEECTQAASATPTGSFKKDRPVQTGTGRYPE